MLVGQFNKKKCKSIIVIFTVTYYIRYVKFHSLNVDIVTLEIRGNYRINVKHFKFKQG